MINKRLLLLVLPFILLAFKQDKEAFRLYNSEGKEIKYSKMMKDLLDADIIMFGELHNNPISHWLQLELTIDLYKELESKLILGAEMFESDNALLLEEYLSGQIREKNFENEAKLWPNYDTDYKPLLQFARDSNLVFVATNIPRRYASLVNKKGFEGLEELSDEAKALIAPLPIVYDPEVGCYKKMLEMGGMGSHMSENFPKAQAIKDATMAHFILANMDKREVFLHFNGAYHSDNKEGIVWYLNQAKPRLKIVTITTVEQKDISELKEESFGIADFILCVPETMTKTY